MSYAEAAEMGRTARKELIDYIDGKVDLNPTQEGVLDRILSEGMGDLRRPHLIEGLNERLRTFRDCLTAEQAMVYTQMFPESFKQP